MLPNWYAILPISESNFHTLPCRRGELYLEVGCCHPLFGKPTLIPSPPSSSSIGAHIHRMVNIGSHLTSVSRIWYNPLSGSIKKGNRKSEILLRDVEVPTRPPLSIGCL